MLAFFRNVGRCILFGNLFIAACAFGLVWQTYLLLELPVRFWQAFLAFLATFSVYNLDGLLPYKFNQDAVFSERKAWLIQHQRIIFISIGIAGCVAFYLFIQLGQMHHLWFIAHLVAISLLYSWRIIPQKGGTYMPLRNVPLVKVFLIAYVWSCVTVLMPVLVINIPVFSSTPIILLFWERFCFLFALTLLFDIRDFEKDIITRTLTFPGLIGVPLTKILSLTFLILFTVLTWLTESGLILLSLELSAVAAGLVVILSHVKRNDYYFLIFADGMMFLQCILVYIAVGI